MEGFSKYRHLVRFQEYDERRSRETNSIPPSYCDSTAMSISAEVERDQAEGYARRKGTDVSEVERPLAPLQNYEPRAKEVVG